MNKLRARYYFTDSCEEKSVNSQELFIYPSFGQFWNFFPLTVCSYHVIYAFQSESTLYSCLNVKDPFSKQARNLKFKWLQRTRTHKHLVRKRTLSHLAKLAKWLSSVVRNLSVRYIWLHVLIMSRTRSYHVTYG